MPPQGSDGQAVRRDATPDHGAFPRDDSIRRGNLDRHENGPARPDLAERGVVLFGRHRSLIGRTVSSTFRLDLLEIGSYRDPDARGVVPADQKNGGGEIDTPAFGLGPPPRRRGERDLRTRKTWPRFRALSARISVKRKKTEMPTRSRIEAPELSAAIGAGVPHGKRFVVATRVTP